MNRMWWVRFLVLAFLIVLAGLFLFPSLTGMKRDSDFFIKKRLNLGLDLQGGIYMTLGVDFEQAFQDQIRVLGQRIVRQARDEGLSTVQLGSLGVKDGDSLDPVVDVKVSESEHDRLYNLIKESFQRNTRLVADETTLFTVGLSNTYKDEIYGDAVDRSIQVIRNRIDEFGVTEPVITSQGEDRIVVQLPGVEDVERAKDLIGQTAKLEFRLVVEEKSPQEVQQIVDQIEQEEGIEYSPKIPFSEYVAQINQAAYEKELISAEHEIAFERIGDPQAPPEKVQWVPYLLQAEARVTGEDLQDAFVSADPQTNQPAVSFNLKPSGASEMGELSGNNVGKRLAIVLDGVIHSAPVLQSKITDSGQITLGRGNYDEIFQQAKDTAIVLRAGALPVKLEFQEQRLVGPSLGQDSIENGTRAALVGGFLVLVFILLFYKASGVIAVTCLILNVSFVLALLVSFDATLTLPGIAGIALTIGMAVDGNVIVFSRIKEELRKGKNALQSVEAGFSKAFSTIIDANITTAVGGFFLLQFGTGPIRGFAVTLLVGIFTTVYTSYFVSKILFEFYMEKVHQGKKPSLAI
jgi:protein-export membrane protein SecD